MFDVLLVLSMIIVLNMSVTPQRYWSPYTFFAVNCDVD